MIKSGAISVSPASSSTPPNYIAPSPQLTNTLHNGLPWQVWANIALLVIITLLQFPVFIVKAPPLAIFVLVANGALAYGLYHLHRWAFIIIIAIAVLSLFAITKEPTGTILNLIFGTILFTAHPHFFNKESNANDAKQRGGF